MRKIEIPLREKWIGSILTPLAFSKERPGYVTCVCECGNSCVVKERLLKDRITRSCGCLKKKAWIQNGKHGRKPLDIVLNINGKEITISLPEALEKYSVVTKAEYKRRRKAGWDYQAALFTPEPPKKPTVKPKHRVFGEIHTISSAVNKFGKVTRQMVYERMAEGMTLEQAISTPVLQGRDTKDKMMYQAIEEVQKKRKAKSARSKKS